MGLVLPINPEHLYSELESIEKIVSRWREEVGGGIVGLDKPAVNAEEKLELFVRQLTGELFFVAGKCQNMAVVLSER